MDVWILVVIHHLIEAIIVCHSWSSVRSIVGQNMIVVSVNCLHLVLFGAGFNLYIYVGHFKLYHKLKSMELVDVTYLAVLDCTMLQSQWLLRLLAFWKFVLMLLIFITNWTFNARDCQLMQHLLCTALTVFALKAFTVLGQIILVAILTQQVWIIIIVWIVFMLQLHNWLWDLYYFDEWNNLIYLCIMWLSKELFDDNWFSMQGNIIIRIGMISDVCCINFIFLCDDTDYNWWQNCWNQCTNITYASSNWSIIGTPVSQGAQGSHQKITSTIGGINNINRRDSASGPSHTKID